MAVLSILKYPDPRLRQKADPVQEITPEITTLISNMSETMYAAKGVGLAATQVGMPVRLFVLGDDSGFKAYLNPEVVDVVGKDKQTLSEGCLSFPGVFEPVERNLVISVRYMTAEGSQVARTVEGFWAVAFQHELDHLNGVLMIDRMGPLRRKMALRQMQKQKGR